ncbi:MAG: hypothetical protein AAF850_01250 [Pseudomonadota bacterium]
MQIKALAWGACVSALSMFIGASAAFAQMAAQNGAQAGIQTGAQSSARTGLYVRASGGISFFADQDADIAISPDLIFIGTPTTEFRIETKTGWTAGAALGFEYNGPFRTEFEYRYLRADADRIVALNGFSNFIGGLPQPREVDEGGFAAHALLANVVLAPKAAALGPLRPFASVGVGGARIFQREGFFSGAARADWAPAFQGRAGLAIAVTETLSVGVDYAYLRTLDLEFRSNAVSAQETVQGVRASTVSFSIEKRF